MNEATRTTVTENTATWLMVLRGFIWQVITYPFVGHGGASLWFLLELLIGQRDRAVITESVGVKTRFHRLLEFPEDLRTPEDELLHLPAVDSREAGEVEEERPAFLLGTKPRGLVVVDDERPPERRLGVLHGFETGAPAF